MNEVNEGIQIPGEGGAPPETPPAEGGGQDVEERARRMGWVPQDEFRGPDKNWVDAEKFIERGETELPILRERLRKMDGTVVTLNNRINGMNKTFAEFREHQKKVAEQAYERGLAAITEKQRQAVKDGDVEAFEAAEEEKRNLKIEAPPEEPEGMPAEDQARLEVEWNEWLVDNQWFNDDQALQRYAAATSRYIQDTEGLTGRELYDKVTQNVKEKFPDKFENPARRQPNMVDTGEGNAPPQEGERKFANLPREAQEQCQRFIETIPGFTKEEYLKEYEWE